METEYDVTGRGDEELVRQASDLRRAIAWRDYIGERPTIWQATTLSAIEAELRRRGELRLRDPDDVRMEAAMGLEELILRAVAGHALRHDLPDGLSLALDGAEEQVRSLLEDLVEDGVSRADERELAYLVQLYNEEVGG